MLEEENFGTLTVQQSTLSDSSAYDGGAIASGDGTLSVIDSTFSGDTASYLGGGLVAWSTSTAISGSTFSSDSAGFGGGSTTYHRRRRSPAARSSKIR